MLLEEAGLPAACALAPARRTMAMKAASSIFRIIANPFVCIVFTLPVAKTFCAPA